MRGRLQAILVAVMAAVVLALSIPLADSIADVSQRRVLADRLDDTKRFASIAEDAITDVDMNALRTDLVQYDRVYGVGVAVFVPGTHVRMASRSTRWWTDPAVLHHVDIALSGRGDATSQQIWPWDERELVVAEPLVRSGDVIGAVVTVSTAGRLRRSIAMWIVALALTALLALAGCVTVASRVASWVLHPVTRLDRAARAIGTGELAARVVTDGGPPELRRLAQSFNDMASRLQSAISRQRAFVADASHQLRNPLQAIQLRIDQLEFAIRPGHERDLQHVVDEVKRLGKILDALLRLASVEATPAGRQRVKVDTVVRDRLTAWSSVANAKDISIQVALESNSFVLLDPTALGTALDAVLDNALKFTPTGGAVRVQLHRRPSTIDIAVSDGGPGLATEELGRVTDRFWRSPRHQNVPGTGLGLSIVQTLLQPYGGNIGVAHGRPSGLVVTLTLPSADAPRQGQSPD